MGIHILGAPGAGVSTLGRALARELDYRFLDTDDFHWFTDDALPYRRRRNPEHRRQLLGEALARDNRWVLSGALCGWGDVFIPQFQAAVHLWLPASVRLARIEERETARYGAERIGPGGDLHFVFEKFCTWAADYDAPEATHLRSKNQEKAWLEALSCPVLRLEKEMPVAALAELSLDFLRQHKVV